MERKYGKPFNELDGSKQEPMSYMNTETHRLTSLPGEKHPFICQRCGGVTGRDIFKDDGRARIIRTSLDRWQEHDHHDKPENKVLVLCNKCSKEVIEQHPRLYSRLQTNEPWPGCMELCVDCKFRDGVSCTHPRAKANGGPGVMINIQKPSHALVDGRNYRGPLTLWHSPPKGCAQKEVQ